MTAAIPLMNYVTGAPFFVIKLTFKSRVVELIFGGLTIYKIAQMGKLIYGCPTKHNTLRGEGDLTSTFRHIHMLWLF